MSTEPSTHGDVTHVPAHRFGIAAGMSGWGWHAVDLECVRRRLATARNEAIKTVDVEVFSVCGARSHLVRKLGAFTYGSRWLQRLRCERCSWVVAINRGTVEQEIDLYTAESGDAPSGDLLRQIFTAILADAPPGREAEAGHRSDLLAHAARHRPVITVCETCSEEGSAAAHGPHVAQCPQAAVRCDECSFTAGSWAGERQGVGECVVAAPCSVLTALAEHYGIPPTGLGGASVITNTPRRTDVGSEANRQRARQAGRQQAVLARMALAALQSQRPAAGFRPGSPNSTR